MYDSVPTSADQQGTAGDTCGGLGPMGGRGDRGKKENKNGERVSAGEGRKCACSPGSGSGGKKSATEKEVGGIFSSSPFFSFFYFCGLRRENHPHGLTLTFDENIPRRAVFLFTSVRFFTGTILSIFSCFFCLPISHFTFLLGDRHGRERGSR